MPISYYHFIEGSLYFLTLAFTTTWWDEKGYYLFFRAFFFYVQFYNYFAYLFWGKVELAKVPEVHRVNKINAA